MNLKHKLTNDIENYSLTSVMNTIVDICRDKIAHGEFDGAAIEHIFKVASINLVKEESGGPCPSRNVKTYPAFDSNGRAIRVTIPENDDDQTT
jgi:hypothetical protein